MVETPDSWVSAALTHRSELMIDHANCEKKAASNAMNLLYRYVDKRELLIKLTQLAREELLHFEQVLQLMDSAKVEYTHLSPGRYAAGLHKNIRTHEPSKLIDSLIVGAIVEARSCERFHKLAKKIAEPLSAFYKKLFSAEARHFQDYLHLANLYSEDDNEVPKRVAFFLELESELILQPDAQFRFLSGAPVGN